MRFWDTSAIIPLCVKEEHTLEMTRLAKEDGELVVWWGTVVECYSAFARLRQEGIIDVAGENRLRDHIEHLAREWTEITPGQEVREQAGRLLRLHSLRASDSLQLAAALIWANHNPRGHYFICLDNRLREAARREGFTLLGKLDGSTGSP